MFKRIKKLEEKITSLEKSVEMMGDEIYRHTHPAIFKNGDVVDIIETGSFGYRHEINGLTVVKEIEPDKKTHRYLLAEVIDGVVKDMYKSKEYYLVPHRENKE